MAIEYTADKEAAMLRLAFDQICDKTDWKNPIDAIVPWDMANVYLQSIEFMTGTKGECQSHPSTNYRAMTRITAPGYYAGPCN